MAISCAAFSDRSEVVFTILPHYAMQNSCVVTAGCDQHEAVPYCVVEGQCPPEVKADPDRIEHAPTPIKTAVQASTEPSMGRSPTKIIQPSVR